MRPLSRLVTRFRTRARCRTMGAAIRPGRCHDRRHPSRVQSGTGPRALQPVRVRPGPAGRTGAAWRWLARDRAGGAWCAPGRARGAALGGRGQSAHARTPYARAHWRTYRSGHFPAGLAPAARAVARAAVAGPALCRAARGSLGRAHRRLFPAGAGGGRLPMPGDHDLCQHSGPAQGTAPVSRAGTAPAGTRARCARPAVARQAGRHDRHGHDREAGRLRCARQHHGGGARPWRGARRRVPADRPQVVLLGADVRRPSGGGAHGRRRRPHLVLLRAALSRRRQQEPDPDPAAQGQARQPFQLEQRGRWPPARGSTA